MDTKAAISGIHILQAASPASVRALVPLALIRRLPHGSTLFLEQDDICVFYFLVSGIASLYEISKQGDKRVIFVCGDGDCLNETVLSSSRASANCELLADSVLLSFPADRFLSVMENDFGLTKAVLDSLSRKNQRLYRQMKNALNSLRGDKKIAAKLWKLSRDFGKSSNDGTVITMDLSVTCLAEMVGSKRETVSRQVSALMKAGLVLQKNGRFVIPDRNALKDYFYRDDRSCPPADK